jgi:hypothetical protein
MSVISLSEWLEQFCEWNEAYKKGTLLPEDREHYMDSRHELCRTLLMAQRIAIEPGAARRGALRVARAFQVEFGFPTGEVTAITQDVSTSGLSAIVAEAPPTGSSVWMRLKLGGGAVVVGRCRVVKLIPKPGSMMVAVTFEGLTPDAEEKLESVVCDVVSTELRATLRAASRTVASMPAITL